MNIDLLRRELERHEGVKYSVYLDSVGLKTAGVGHLLTESEKPKYTVGQPVSKEQVKNWFNEDVMIAISRARKILGPDHFDKLDEVRQRIMVNMAFNLGNRLEGFKNTLKFIREGNYGQAAINMRQSLWYKQVKRRGEELCTAMETGKMPF